MCAVSETATEESVVVERDGAVAIVRLNRPARLNAFTTEMCHRLLGVSDELDADDDVRAIVLTGTGRAFCAGADLGAGGDTFVLDDDPSSAPP